MQPTRKDLFGAALRLRQMSQKDFADSIGRTREQVNTVLNGKRESATMLAKIDAFIAETLPMVRKRFSGCLAA